MKMDSDGQFVDDFFGSLPEGFLAKALSLTSPRDACRLSLVSPVFRSAAEWDTVWEAFLPPDYQAIVAEAAEDGGGLQRFPSKKQLFLDLCDRPLIVDGGSKSFSLDKETGKKCYMLAARKMSIIWGDTPPYWRWFPLPESRFAEVAELRYVWWFEVQGTISTSLLSPDTLYAAFIVLKATQDFYGFGNPPVEVSVGISGLERQTRKVKIELDPHGENRPKQREDGWLEIELGQYFVQNGEEDELEMRMAEVNCNYLKRGIVIQGIEIRPAVIAI